jgi:WD40 repeat protein
MLNRAKLIGEISDGLRGPVKCVSFSPDGSVIATISQTVRADLSELQFWNAQTRKPTGEGIRVDGSRCRAFHPTLNQFVLDRSNETLVLDWRTRKQIGPSLPCCSAWIAVTPNSGKLISAGYDGKIRVWDVTGEQPKDYVIVSLGRRASTALLNSEGTRLAVAGTDGKAAGWVELIDVTTGSRLLNLRLSLSPVARVAFHPTDQILIIGSENGAILLWDLRHSEVIGEPLKSGNRMLNDLSISPDGRAIAAAYKDGSVILWSLDLDKWRLVACRIANRTLAPDEWKRFVGDATPRGRCLEPGPFPRSPR